MKTNDLFYTSIFRLRTGVFIGVNYSCPARVILSLQVSNKTRTFSNKPLPLLHVRANLFNNSSCSCRTPTLHKERIIVIQSIRIQSLQSIGSLALLLSQLIFFINPVYQLNPYVFQSTMSLTTEMSVQEIVRFFLSLP